MTQRFSDKDPLTVFFAVASLSLHMMIGREEMTVTLAFDWFIIVNQSSAIYVSLLDINQ